MNPMQSKSIDTKYFNCFCTCTIVLACEIFSIELLFFCSSNDPEKDNVGNKWSSSAVFRYLRDQGHDTNSNECNRDLHITQNYPLLSYRANDGNRGRYHKNDHCWRGTNLLYPVLPTIPRKLFWSAIL